MLIIFMEYAVPFLLIDPLGTTQCIEQIELFLLFFFFLVTCSVFSKNIMQVKINFDHA